MWAMIEKLRMWAWSAIRRSRLGRSTTQPADDQLLDLARLGDSHREHQPGVEETGRGARDRDRDDLGRQRATEEMIEHHPDPTRDRRHDCGRDHDPDGDHQRLATLEATVEA